MILWWHHHKLVSQATIYTGYFGITGIIFSHDWFHGWNSGFVFIQSMKRCKGWSQRAENIVADPSAVASSFSPTIRFQNQCSFHTCSVFSIGMFLVSGNNR